MKTSILLAMSAAIATFGAFAADSQWTYNSTAGTISDGDWTFAATVSGTDLTVGAVSADPGAGATLDFSKAVTDGSATYTIVTLNPNFAEYANKTNLTALVLPATGLITISADAFNGCTSLTSVSPFLPDSVTTIGERGFKSVPAQQDLSLKGVVTLKVSAFYECGILSVAFGPDLKCIETGWNCWCFYHCANLKTVSFDAGMSDAKIQGEGAFANCSKLEGVVDLRGFKDVGNRPFYTYGGKISKLMLSSSATFRGNLMHSMGSTKQVEFDGGVPPTQTPTFYSHFDQSHLSDLYIVVPEEYKDEWAVYCEDGVINDIDSYWSAEYVTRARSNSIHLIYKSSSSGGGELGTWIYDASAGIVTNTVYGWSFHASNVAKSLTVGTCVTYPPTPSPLDFSASVTDTEGGFMFFEALNPSMCVGSGSTAAPADCGLAISEIVFPVERLSSIGNYAFAWTTNVTSITPFLPDCIALVGEGAFFGCPVGGDLRAISLETLNGRAFKRMNITSATFGPGLKRINGGYLGGPVSECPNLTNIVFDAAMSNCVVYGEMAFHTNPKLVGIDGVVDCSGISRFDAGIAVRPFHECTQITNLVFGEDLVFLKSDILRTLYNLKSVTFNGPPPTNVVAIFNEPNEGKKIKVDQKVVTYIRKKYKDDWLAYAEGGVINGRNPNKSGASTWKREYIDVNVTDLSMRPLVTLEPDSGLYIIVR